MQHLKTSYLPESLNIPDTIKTVGSDSGNTTTSWAVIIFFVLILAVGGYVNGFKIL